MIELKNKVVDIAIAAGAVILDIYNNASDLEIQSKDDNSPLTKADRAANEVICNGLEKLIPSHPIISEENKQLGFDIRKDYEYTWMVDPLDGTKEFIKRNGEFTVNIALIKDGKVIMGVVYAPVLNETYWAIKGEGAFLIDQEGERKITANTFTLQDSGLRVVCSRSHLNDETQAFVDDLNAPELVAKGSSLKFLILAKGEADLYPRIAPTMEWDTAAAHIVLEEAGGTVVRYEDKLPLEYNKENLLNPFFVASGNVHTIS